ncbi:hypothetical protein [Myroides marinus]|uniref:hypothetical protein n=1 Tax=Myroides marinus TaxID=703342 RepID=UPI0025749659|nr:hypothetical protein [Myroides marinus]MDM1373829.1 hypothetical protein [Myroides marinus]
MKKVLLSLLGVFMFISCSSDTEDKSTINIKKDFENPLEYVGKDHNIMLYDMLSKMDKNDTKEFNIKNANSILNEGKFEKTISSKLNKGDFKTNEYYNLNNIMSDYSSYLF